MSKKARVRSTDSLEFLLARLVVVSDDLAGITAAARSSANRGLHRIRVEERARWTRELELATKGLKEAKSALSRAELQKDIGKPSVVEEQRALVSAKQRYRRAEDKLQRVASWSAKLQKASDEFQSSVAPLRSFAISRLDKAGTDLEKTLDLLFEYMRVSAPSPGGPDSAGDGQEETDTTASRKIGEIGLVRARVKALAWPERDAQVERVDCPNIQLGITEAPGAAQPSEAAQAPGATQGGVPRVLCEPGIDLGESCYLARTRSGWVIGSISGHAGDLQEVSDPGRLGPVLGLPIGCIVLVRNGRAEEIVDRFNMPIRGVLGSEEDRS
ncbi:MAG: hypothetical protein ACI89L_002591 [Phycisphaerales bacterium]|jgi:hypothetical protein